MRTFALSPLFVWLIMLLLIGLSCEVLADRAQVPFAPQPNWSRSHLRWRAFKSLYSSDSTQEASSVSPCQVHGLPEKQPGSENATQQSATKVVDCFLASNELDMMEIRLRELETVVDVFVVVESRMTFRGNPRSLRFPSLVQRLPAMVINKVVYHVLEELEGNNAWEREIYQRNTLFEVAVDKAKLQPGDILMVSDCDEIPKPSFIRALRQCGGVTFPVTMGAVHHYYSFSLKSTSVEVWPQPRAILYNDPLQVKANEVRNSQGHKMYLNSSWHCSSCFSHISAVQKKIVSFSHSELDLPEHRDVHNIVSRVRQGIDLFNRPSQLYTKDDSGDMPQYISQHPTRFSYLISRDVGDAGFWDIGLRGSWADNDMN